MHQVLVSVICTVAFQHYQLRQQFIRHSRSVWPKNNAAMAKYTFHQRLSELDAGSLRALKAGRNNLSNTFLLATQNATQS